MEKKPKWRIILGWVLIVCVVFIPSLLFAHARGWIDNVFGLLGVVFCILAISGIAANLIKK